MKTQVVSVLLAAAAGLLAVQAPAHAGTILNIQGYSTGDNVGSGIDNPSALVGSTVHFSNPVTLYLAAGDYRITDAAHQPGALYDAWDFQNGADGSWTNHFSVGAWQGSPTDNSAYTLLLDALPGTDTGHFGGFYTEAAADAAFQAHAPFTLHLDQAGLVGFVAPDYDLWDNLGGISIEIEQVGGPSTVPEPANLMLMLAGLGGLASVARRRGQSRG